MVLVILLSYWIRRRPILLFYWTRYNPYFVAWLAIQIYGNDMIFVCKRYAREGGLWILYAWACFCFAFLCRITQEHCGNCSWFFMKKIYSGYKFSIMRGWFQIPVYQCIGWIVYLPICATIEYVWYNIY